MFSFAPPLNEDWRAPEVQDDMPVARLERQSSLENIEPYSVPKSPPTSPRSKVSEIALHCP